jgi:hypothetical protein
MKVGDLVKMKEGRLVPGIITEFTEVGTGLSRVRVLWSNSGLSLEKVYHIEVINESR